MTGGCDLIRRDLGVTLCGDRDALLDGADRADTNIFGGEHAIYFPRLPSAELVFARLFLVTAAGREHQCAKQQ